MEFKVNLYSAEVVDGEVCYEIQFWTGPGERDVYNIAVCCTTNDVTEINMQSPLGNNIASGISKCVSRLNGTPFDEMNFDLLRIGARKTLTGVVLEVIDRKKDVTYRTYPIPFGMFKSNEKYKSVGACFSEDGKVQLT